MLGISWTQVVWWWNIKFQWKMKCLLLFKDSSLLRPSLRFFLLSLFLASGEWPPPHQESRRKERCGCWGVMLGWHRLSWGPEAVAHGNDTADVAGLGLRDGVLPHLHSLGSGGSRPASMDAPCPQHWGEGARDASDWPMTILSWCRLL